MALLALLALSAFVFDYGVMWASRGQAQNSADAGALAGAQSLLLLQGDDAARNAATALATRHSIFGQNVVAGNVTVTVPLPCPAPFNTPSGCIKVDISKQDVPTFFARLVNIQTQGVRATATAMVGAGNAVQCIKPWIVADRWTDNSSTGSNTSRLGSGRRVPTRHGRLPAAGIQSRGTRQRRRPAARAQRRSERVELGMVARDRARRRQRRQYVSKTKSQDVRHGSRRWACTTRLTRATRAPTRTPSVDASTFVLA